MSNYIENTSFGTDAQWSGDSYTAVHANSTGTIDKIVVGINVTEIINKTTRTIDEDKLLVQAVRSALGLYD